MASTTEPTVLPVTWRPRRTRAVLLAASGMIIIAFTVLAMALPESWKLNDRVMLVMLGLIFSGVVLMVARPRAVADEGGLLVVNLVRSRRLHWAEVLRVNLKQGDPWVTLDLADGTSLAVMGIQPSFGRDQAVRAALQLRDLAETRGAAPEPAAA
jgi:hypothetical protein